MPFGGGVVIILDKGKVVFFILIFAVGICLLYSIGNLPTYFGDVERTIFVLLTLFLIIGGFAWCAL